MFPKTSDPMVVLAEALAPHLKDAKYKHNTPTGTASTPYYTGPGGLFGVAGLERELISARIQPEGLASVLPAFPSTTTTPLFPYIMGFLAETGDNAETPCADGPIAGPGKSCIQTAQFGRYTMRTRELDVTRVGQQMNRGEFQDLTLVNDPFAEELGSILAQSYALGRQSASMLGSEMLMRFIEVGVAFQNILCPQLYTGNPTNNNAGGGYAEFPGLDILIGTTKVDALTNDACYALASDVKDFNYGLVTNVDLNPSILETMTYMFRYLRHNAAKMNFGTTRWVLSMRNDLFYELTSIWACSYLTYRCWVGDVDAPNAVPQVDATEGVRFRDDMRNGRYLLIDGIRVEVIIDDCIAEESNADTSNLSSGQFASDIYFVPMSVRGGMPVTYWQFYDYSAGSLPAIAQGNYQQYFWADGGRFLWHAKPPVNWCIQHIALIEPRVLLRTPQLAGRITNVAYAPLQHTRDPLPDQTYFVDGGVSTARPGPSLWSEWDGTQR